MKKSLVAAALLAAGSLSAGVIYQEDFQKLGNFAPGVVRAPGEVGIDNEPCWEQYFAMWARPKKDLLLWEKGIPLAKGDFDFGFEIKDNAPAGWTLVLGDVKLPVKSDVKLGWGAVQVKGRGGKADVYLMTNRVYKIFAKDVKLPKGIETANVIVPKDGNVSIKNVLSETARSDFQIDSSIKRLYADFASLEQPFDGKVCDKPEVVAMPNAPACGIRLQKNNGNIDIVREKADGSGISSNKVTIVSNETLKDGALEFPGITRRYVLPHLFAWGSRVLWGDPMPQMVDLKRDFGMLPTAAKHVTDIDFVKTKDGTQIWVDGNYVLTDKSTKPFKFVLSGGAKYAMKPAPAKEAPVYQKLDFAANPKAKTFAKAELKSIKPGRQQFGVIPVDIVKPIDSQDIAICHQIKGAWALEVEEYFSDNRSPLTGFPSESHFLVPAALYNKLAFVFALDPDPKKDAILTVTMGRYKGEIGGNKLVQQSYDFTAGVPDWCKKIGEVVKNGKSVPLYYAVVPLNLGKILDFTSGDYMDIEFTGKLWENFQQDDKSMRPDPASTSAFNLFGATLVKVGYNAEIVMSNPGNVVTEDVKNRKTAIQFNGTSIGGKFTVNCTVTDTGENIVKTMSNSYRVNEGGKQLVELDYSNLDLGWYKLEWEVYEGKDLVFSHRGALAVLPKADRLIKDPKKSPYATWLFMGTHGAPTNREWAAQLMKNAGICKSGIEKDYLAKYNLTSIGSVYAPKEGEVIDKNDPMKINPDYEKICVEHIQKQLKDKPFADHVMLWHESAPSSSDQFNELLGLPVNAPDDLQKRRYFRWASYISETGRVVHKHFPGLRLQIGNSSASMGAVSLPMRGGVDWKAFDSIGLESPSQMVPPERMTEVGLLGFLYPQTLASKAAGRKIPVNGCYEFIYRSERDIGQQLQAEYQARDIAICHIQGFTLISPGIFFDCSSGYYNGLWGGSGIMERTPWCYPKRAYVAYAVATKVMDGVKYEKCLDTGSSTVYAVQMKRIDGKYVTAIWSVRGTFDFTFDGSAQLIGLYGRKAEKKGSESIVYAVSSSPLKNFKISNRAFPFEDGIFKEAEVVCDLADAKYTVKPDDGITSTTHGFFPQLKPGEFDIAKVADEERGDCLEVTLKSDPAKTTSFWTEFTTIRFDEPIPVPGEPSLLGVEVMGNSNWGQLRFEIEDADGEIFKNVNTGDSWGCDIMDWPGRLAVAFDGWSWVCQSLRANKLLPDHSPATYEEQWQSMGGDKKIRYPIKVRALTIGMNRDKTTLEGFVPAALSIRVKSIRAR